MENMVATAVARNGRISKVEPANNLQEVSEKDPVVKYTMDRLIDEAKVFGARTREELQRREIDVKGARYAIRVMAAQADARHNLTAVQMARVSAAAFEAAGLKPEPCSPRLPR